MIHLFSWVMLDSFRLSQAARQYVLYAFNWEIYSESGQEESVIISSEFPPCLYCYFSLVDFLRWATVE